MNEVLSRCAKCGGATAWRFRSLPVDTCGCEPKKATDTKAEPHPDIDPIKVATAGVFFRFLLMFFVFGLICGAFGFWLITLITKA